MSLDDMRLARNVEKLHALGPRAMFEMLRELATGWNVGTPVDRLAERYAAIDKNTLVALGGCHIPHRPFLMIKGGRHD